MKKLMVLAMMATLLMAGSAFAVTRTVPLPNATFSFGSPGIAAGPTTTNNDDSCDISVAPAATLLLPYFEVDPNPTVQGQTTLFTITNVSRFPQIAHVTVWTDLSFPVLDFNIFLTGYDVQPINLYDVIVRGVVAPNNGTTSATTPGALSAANNANPNIVTTSAPCLGLPGGLPQTLQAAVKSALTTGVYNPGNGITACSTAGLVHANAIGYVTIDVAADCSTKFPNDPTYYNTGTGEILFDNVLIGDYQQLGPAAAGTAASSFDGAGNPMVHIRAVPEGGGAGIGNGAQPGTNLPYTFYDRYTPPSTARSIAVSRCRRRLLPASSRVAPARSRRTTRSGVKVSPVLARRAPRTSTTALWPSRSLSASTSTRTRPPSARASFVRLATTSFRASQRLRPTTPPVRASRSSARPLVT
jgi:hypothetical protein